MAGFAKVTDPVVHSNLVSVINDNKTKLYVDRRIWSITPKLLDGEPCICVSMDCVGSPFYHEVPTHQIPTVVHNSAGDLSFNVIVYHEVSSLLLSGIMLNKPCNCFRKPWKSHE